MIPTAKLFHPNLLSIFHMENGRPMKPTTAPKEINEREDFVKTKEINIRPLAVLTFSKRSLR
jgi:hypothetical protein